MKTHFLIRAERNALNRSRKQEALLMYIFASTIGDVVLIRLKGNVVAFFIKFFPPVASMRSAKFNLPT